MSVAILSRLSAANPPAGAWRSTLDLLARQVAARGGSYATMTTSPTVTLGTGTAALGGTAIDKSDSRIRRLGGQFIDPAGTVYPNTILNKIVNKTYVSGLRIGTLSAIEFDCSSPKFEILVHSDEMVRVVVDGQQSENNFTSTIGDGTPRWLLIDMTPISASIIRRQIRLESSGAMLVGGINLDISGGQIFAPCNDAGLKLTVLGDSFVEPTGPDYAWNGLGSLIAKALGFSDFSIGGFGGTGWTTSYPFSPEVRRNLLDRAIVDGVANASDVFLIDMGVNDPAGVGPAVRQTIAKLRAGVPKCLIFIGNAWNPNAPAAPSAAKLLVNSEIKAACAGQAGVFHTDLSTISYTKIIDGVHPDTGGHATLAAAQGNLIKAFLPTPPILSSAPVCLIAPSILGTFVDDENLYAQVGQYLNNPTSFSYQWKLDGTNISGATGEYYSPQTSDLGHTITCVVTATNGAGSISRETPGVTNPYGPNLLPSNILGSSSGWVLHGSGLWSIASNKLTGALVDFSAATYAISLAGSTTYRFKCDVNRSAGQGTVQLNSTTFPGLNFLTSGRKTSIVAMSAAVTALNISGNASNKFTGDISNISLRKVL